MTLLITGGTGFVGGHLLRAAKRRLQEKGDQIVALTSMEIPGYIDVLHNGYTFQKEDFKKKGIEHIDAVIHLGGFSPKSRREMNRIDDYLSSIRSTSYLLEHLPNVPKHIVFCSTIHVYKEKPGEVVSEETVPEPQTLYGAYKLFCEKMITTWATEHHVIPHILRLGNAFGPGEDRYQYSIPLMIQQALRGENLLVYVDPAMRRNYIYISDVCNMFLNALSLESDVGPINVVSQRNITINEVVQSIVAAANGTVTWSVKEDYPAGGDILFDNRKAARYLGREEVSFEKGIVYEMDYFRNKL